MIGLDIEDVIGSGCWMLLRQSILGVFAVWTGGFIAGVASEFGTWVCGAGSIDLECIAFSPAAGHWFAMLGTLLLAVLPLGFFIRREQPGVVAWGVAAAFQALVMLGAMVVFEAFDGGLEIGIVFLIALVQLGMMSWGLWFVHRWLKQRWAAEMAMLQAENAARRAELESKYGTSSAGVDQDGEWR